MALKNFVPQEIKDFINWQRLKARNRNQKIKKSAEDWRKLGSNTPPPHSIKQEAINKIREKYGINILVETGTFRGEMVYAQRENFKKIYSIELSEELHKKAEKNLSKFKNIKLLQGDSGEILKLLVPKLNEPALFWLDGHYSGFETAKGNLTTPILQELQTILNSGKRHYILIDDARLFNGTNDYPELEVLKKQIESFDKNYSFNIEEDIIRILPS